MTSKIIFTNLFKYTKMQQQQLTINNMETDPLEQFKVWYKEAEKQLTNDYTACTLATATLDGRPSARVVLLKDFDKNGFVFYTNYKSTKSKQLLKNTHAALNFYWPELNHQIIIRGTAEKTTREEAEEYFRSRPRGSQLGAWASEQSSVIPNRGVLEAHFKKLEEKFKGQSVPLPEFWGGFRIKPSYYEFWQSRPDRLHDRFAYKWEDNDTWKIEQLSP